MSGELLIQIVDIARSHAIRPALDEINAKRRLSPATQAVLHEAADICIKLNKRDLSLPPLVERILKHPELDLRVFLSPREVDVILSGSILMLCFENGGAYSFQTLIGPSWVVLEKRQLGEWFELDWYRSLFIDSKLALPYPKRGFEGMHWVLSQDEVKRLAEIMYRLKDETASPRIQSAAVGLYMLAAKALSHDELTLAYEWLL